MVILDIPAKIAYFPGAATGASSTGILPVLPNHRLEACATPRVEMRSYPGQIGYLMTLQPYDPKMMDEFALQLLDLASTVREMANRCREHGVDDFAVHDKKALQWHANLQKWARRAQAELEIRILDSRASRRASDAND